jgi:hypothetical protein
VRPRATDHRPPKAVRNVGRENGVIDDQLYGLLVLMAVVTTLLTQPLLSVLDAGRVRTVIGSRGRNGPMKT